MFITKISVSNWRLLPATGMLIGLKFKSTRAIRQQHSHTGIICLRAFTATVKRQTHLCASCRCSRVPDTSSAGSRPRFAPRFPAIPLPRFAFPPTPCTHYASFREEYVIYARRIIRELAINHSSRPSRVTAFVSSSLRAFYLRQIVLVYTTSTPERAEVSVERECIRIEWNRIYIDRYVET